MNIVEGDNVNDFLLPKWGKVGSLGDVQFVCSSKEVMTFDDYKRKTAARFAEHKLIGRAPLLEFLGEDLDEISFKIKLVRTLGVKPEKAAEELRDLCLRGSAEFLIIGGEVIGLFCVESIDEEVEHWQHNRILVSELRLRLKRYVDNDLRT